jgi:hypothetical protein
VPAAPDGDLQAVLAGEPDGLLYVRLRGDVDNRIGKALGLQNVP